MEIPSDAFDTLIQRLRNELTVAIGHCDLLEIEAARQGMCLGSAVKVRECCERAVEHLEAWRQAHLTPFRYLVRPEFVESWFPWRPRRRPLKRPSSVCCHTRGTGAGWGSCTIAERPSRHRPSTWRRSFGSRADTRIVWDTVAGPSSCARTTGSLRRRCESPRSASGGPRRSVERSLTLTRRCGG